LKNNNKKKKKKTTTRVRMPRTTRVKMTTSLTITMMKMINRKIKMAMLLFRVRERN